jgi:multidrug resistance efflux pump
LGAKDLALKDKVTTSFYTISSLQKQLSSMNSADITDQNVTTYLKTYQSIVTSLNDHFVLMKKLFIESIEDARYKAQMTLSQNTFTALQTKNSSINASITSQLNSIRSYFSSYEDQQQSLQKQIESLRTQIDLAKKSLTDAQFNANI